MHTEVRIKTIGKNMKELFDTLEHDADIMIKSYKTITDVSDKDYNEDEEYIYDVYIRHNEGIDPKKELIKELKNLD